MASEAAEAAEVAMVAKVLGVGPTKIKNLNGRLSTLS